MSANYIIYAVIDVQGNRLTLEYSCAKLKSIKDYNRRKYKDLKYKDIVILKNIDNVSENEAFIEYYIYKNSINYELKNELLNEYNNIINNINEKYEKDASVKKKIVCLKKYISNYNNDENFLISEILVDEKELMRQCDMIDNYKSKLCLLCDIKMICKDNDYGNTELFDLIDSKMSEYKKISIEKDLKQIPRNNYSYNDLIELYNKYSIDTKEYLWLSCNLLIPPRRSDWYHARYILLDDFEKLETIDESVNYLIIHKNYIELYFNNYKTRKSYGPYRKVLLNNNYDYFYELEGKTLINPSKLSEILLKSYYDKPRKNLFGDYNDSISKYTSFVDSFLKKDIDLRQTDFRILFISYIVNVLKLSAFVRTLIMPDMGHKSFDLQEIHYIKKGNAEVEVDIIDELINEVNSDDEIDEEIDEEIDDDINDNIIREIIMKGIVIEENEPKMKQENKELIEEDEIIRAYNNKINMLKERIKKLEEQKENYISMT